MDEMDDLGAMLVSQGETVLGIRHRPAFNARVTNIVVRARTRLGRAIADGVPAATARAETAAWTRRQYDQLVA